MESKPVIFRCKYERYQTYIGDRPANAETNQPAKAGKLIVFSRFQYVTSDPKEIAMLREEVAANPNLLTEVKPEKKIRLIDDDESAPDLSTANEEKAQESEQEESTTKPKAKK